MDKCDASKMDKMHGKGNPFAKGKGDEKGDTKGKGKKKSLPPWLMKKGK